MSAITDWLNEQQERGIETLMYKLLDRVGAYNHGPISYDVSVFGLEMTVSTDKQSDNVITDNLTEKTPI